MASAPINWGVICFVASDPIFLHFFFIKSEKKENSRPAIVIWTPQRGEVRNLASGSRDGFRVEVTIRPKRYTASHASQTKANRLVPFASNSVS